MLLLKEYGKGEDAEKLVRGELRWLKLSGCMIGDDGAVILAAFIKVNDTLVWVGLVKCNIGPHGAKAIADALKCNKRVYYLGLIVNQIGDVCV